MLNSTHIRFAGHLLISTIALVFVTGISSLKTYSVNPHTHQLKLCDFRSAKMLMKGEPNVYYICSRCYRAPELIFGATEYTTTIDMKFLSIF
ncbi:hypothetical protein CsatA_011692 [Cannabis sativa]